MNARAKGTRGEQEIARFYRALGYGAVRVPNSGGLDVPGDVIGVPGIHIEIKRAERLRLWEGLAQAERDAPENTIPTLHFRRDRDIWWVAIPLGDFARMLHQFHQTFDGGGNLT